MAKQQIPDREPIGDVFTGVICQFDNLHILSPAPVASTVEVARGNFVVRYGVTYLGKPHYSIVPDLVVADYGDMLVGEDAWIFLIKQSNLYPRADVLGYRNDGRDEMIVVKELDFAIPFDVLAFADADAKIPLAKLAVLIAPEAGTPERILEYLPRYDTLADWQASRE